MKLLILFTVVACLQATAEGFSQTVTLSLENVPLEKAFKEIKKQTGYSFVYTRIQLKNTSPVTCQIKNGQLKDALEQCFRNQPLSFMIEDRYIIVQTKPAITQTTASLFSTIDIAGKVVNENGEALVGVTISAKKSNQATFTNAKGEFSLKGINEDDILTITSIGYYKEDIPVNKQTNMLIKLRIAVGTLDETMVIAYGTTTKRLSTSSISKITSEEIAKQPVTNPLAILQGRVPGLIVTSTSGLPGSSFKIQIRGQSSLNAALNQVNPFDQPLFIIDGVPFAPQNSNINQYQSLASPGTNEIYGNPYGGISPFNNINASDIESIEILRDADATAIYGSRGANGVVLITTKKGKAGKTKFTFSIYTGANQVTRTMPLMNTEQYLSMRKQAFSNDGISPSTILFDESYAPDLLVFDSTRNVDWKKYFLGGTSHITDANANLSGGSSNTQFLIGAGFRHESYIFPGDFGNKVGSANINLHHNSLNRLFSIDFSANYSYTQNNSSGSPSALVAYTLPPNYPDLLTSNGGLNWEHKGIDLYDNPLSYLKQKYSLQSYNLISHLQAKYELIPGLSILASIGYNTLNSDEKSLAPKSSQDPAQFPTSYASFGTNDFRGWIIEPQIEYKKILGRQKWEVLAGATIQQNTNSKLDIFAYNYSNDNLLGSISGASDIYTSDAFSQYKYSALFGRINYIFNNRYIVNINGRRDGSSRFGPGRQFGNFGSLASAWLFSEESYIKKHLPIISYGKLRFSYGSTGNDNIGDYQYLSRWSPVNPYQGTNSYLPQNLFNPDFSWATTRKLELGLELGFFKDRILTTMTFYRHRSKNQLIIYSLPSQTGFTGITSNFPALVQNSGLELQLSTTNVKTKNFSWTSSLNLTVPRNKLISFPGIGSTPYAQKYVVGKSLNVLNTFRFLGVNDTTGIYLFESKDGPTSNPLRVRDYYVFGDLDPKFYGGVTNTLSYKGFQLYALFQFAKQIGPNYLQQVNNFSPPGTMYNLPIVLLDNWGKTWDNSEIQKFTSNNRTVAGRAATNFASSDGAYSDASYLRLKALSFSYALPDVLLKKLKMASARIYLNVQNLFTITKYKGNDPETQSFYSLPPSKTIVAGFQLTF